MKKTLITLLVVGMFVSVSGAAVYAIEDFVPNFGFDDGTGAWQPLSCNGWGSYADQGYTWAGFKDVGESEAITGDKVLAFGNVADTGQPVAPAWAGWGSWMSTGDTWTITLAYKKDSDTTSAADLMVGMMYNGGYYGRVTIPAAQITDEWQTLEYSYTHTGEGWWPNTWTFRMDATTPNGIGAGAGGVYVDMVPEPATLSLLGFGALGFIRRKK